jgi:hypothetical protein
MKRFARVRCGTNIHEREIDSQGRMILAHIGNIPSISHKLVTREKIMNENDVRKRFRLITLDPIDSVEFIESPE